MGVINDNIGILYLGIAAGLYFKPEYAMFDSRVLTLASVFAGITVWRIFYRLALYPDFFTPAKHIQTPTERSWLTGNSKSMFLQTPYPQMREWLKTMPNTGLIRYYIVGNMERVMLTSPKALSELLVTKVYDFEKPGIVRTDLRRIAGNGVLVAEGEEHKVQRKSLMPAFAYRHIKDLYPIFWSKSVEMVNLIEQDLQSRKSTGDNTVQIRDWASRATLDIIGMAGMDQDFDSLRNPHNKLNRAYRKIITSPSLLTRILIVVSLLFVHPKYLAYLPTERNKDIKEGSELIRNTARKLIRRKKSKMEDPNAETGVDILSVALRSGTFDEENLIDQSMTFLAAGHETTATALQWSVYALCKNPGVQTRLRDEIRTHLPPISVSHPDPITAAQIDSLPYLNAVCNEILRFHPSVPMTIRTAVRETTLVGTPIPKDTFIVMSPEILNHMKEFWGPDADKFDPERFMAPGAANTGGATSNYANLTFLHGPRSCIGQSFAKSELACLLAAMVGRFQMELKFPDAKLEVREGATVSPKDGVLARLTPLEGW